MLGLTLRKEFQGKRLTGTAIELSNKNKTGATQIPAAEFRPHIKNKLITEVLEKIRSKFTSIEHIGPKWVADFLEVADKEDRDIIMRRAYEKVSELLDILKISSWEEKA